MLVFMQKAGISLVIKKPMKRYSILLIFVLCFWSTSQAQLLWEISGKGLSESSYLYGTIHVGDERVYSFSPQVEPAFKRTEAFAGELVLEPSAMFAMMNALFMPQDTTLKDLLPEEKYKKLQERLNQELGMMALYAERIKPVYLSMLLVQQNTGDTLHAQREPLDLYFQESARKQGKEVLGLETAEEQLAALDRLPLRRQAEMLYEELENPSPEQDSDQLIRLYETKNLDSLYQIVSQGMDADLGAAMLTERNYRMTERLEKLIRQQPTFIGVGAAHLPGPEGLIELLRAKGYTVEPAE